jgi:eukaryotic-like serine/threonine-protein kinase
MLVLMGGRAADSPPEGLGSAAKKPPAQTLELVEADLDPPGIDDLGIAPGAVIADKYVVEREIGRGGIGVILAAHHRHLDQRVAIKYLQKKVLGNVTIIDRFAREARLAAKIKSDHVVRVHDVSSDPALGPYMVMEFLEGTDLGQMIEAGPLPIADAVDYVLQACDALAEAHVLGIVHRDLKPDNLFLAKRPAGRSIVKILDFGISKSAPTRRGSGDGGHVTTASEAFGTPVYMSPEQLRSSASVDARSDIWALGVVLFELLTAEVPFVGDSVGQLCTSILADAPRALRSLRPQAAPELESAVRRCLEKDPGRRFRNVAELAQEIARFGPEGAQARVRHIARIVQDSGSSVRPPTPMPGTYQVGQARAVVEAARATGAAVTVPRLPVGRPKGVILAATAGALVVIAGLIFALGSSSRTTPAATPSSSVSSTPTATSTATATWTATTTATATDVVAAPGPSAQPLRASPKPSQQVTPPPSATAPAVTVTPAPPPVPKPKPLPKDDYSQFGGQQ